MENDENKWHEKQIDEKTVTQKMINEYINSFTLHGLTKIFMSRSKLESIFWFIMLTSGILLSTYVSVTLVNKYISFEVYTEIKLQITDRNYFPALTICERNHLYKFYYSYCGYFGGLHPNDTFPCNLKNPKINGVNITGVNETWWSNSYFNVTKCTTWGGKKCAREDFFTSLGKYNHACIGWNYKGHIYDMYSHTDMEFTYNRKSNPQPDVIFMAHDPLVSEIDLTNAISIEPKKYDINLEKTFITRMPHPYPSKCSDDKAGDMFPEKYTRRGCLETMNYIGMYKECGDTLDYTKQYIPKSILKKYKRNDSIATVRTCMQKFGTREANSSAKNCPFPCSELDVNMLVSSRDYFESEKVVKPETFTVGIQYLKVDSFRVIQEKPLYSGYQMACEIGGLIGLMVGCSLLSAVEIIVCAMLYFINTIVKKH